MGTASSLFGKKGEEIAGRFLTSRGYRILDRNFRTPRGEIDLIVLDGEYLVFVEVKSRRGNRFGAPQDAVDRRKQEHLIKASQFYMTRKKLENICCRFDLVVVEESASGQTRVKHIQNTVEVAEWTP